MLRSPKRDLYITTRAQASKEALELIQKGAPAREPVFIAFGESLDSWISRLARNICPGAALWNHAPTKEIFAELRENSISIDGPEVAPVVGNCTRPPRSALSSGSMNGLSGDLVLKTLYNSLLTFSPDGRLANHHPKLVPTFTERLVWGPGDGRQALKSVDIGQARVGGTDLLGALWMPPGANGYAPGWRTHTCRCLAYRERDGTARESSLCLRRPMLRDVRWSHDALHAEVPRQLPHEVTDKWVERGGKLYYCARLDLR